MKNNPPLWAQQFLRWFTHPHFREDIEGDLQELFEERVQMLGLPKARMYYVWDVFRSMRPYHLQKERLSRGPLYWDMFTNYFSIALRHFWRNKVYSFLNVIGLASGLAISLVIFLFISHELNYDGFHEHGERIVRIGGDFSYNGNTMHISGLSPAVAPALLKAHSQVEAFVRTKELDRVQVGKGNHPQKRFRETKWLFADSSFLSVFSFPLLAGHRQTALAQAQSVLITPEMAKKYFGEQNPIGQTLSLFINPDPFFKRPAQQIVFTVTGIIKPAPSHSSISYHFVASFHSLSVMEKDQFHFSGLMIGNYPTFFLLKSKQANLEVEKALNGIIQPVMEGVRPHISLISLQELHLKGATAFGSLAYLYIFGAIALLILLLALINYMSLTTARATKRAKEIGIRKVVGAKRFQVMGQFFVESFLMTLIAFVLAFGLMLLIVPAINTLVDVAIPYSFVRSLPFLSLALGVLVASGLISGFYPALLLSAVSPMHVFKGKLSSGRGGALLRRVFTVFQFSASISLIICTLLMGQQLSFIQQIDLGLNKDRLLVLPLEAKNEGKTYQALKEELRKQSMIEGVSTSTGIPFKAIGTNMLFTKTADERQINFYFNNVDDRFLSTLQIEWKHKPRAEYSSISAGNTIIINETAASELGISASPVGQQIPFGEFKREVIGVIKDFHFMSLQQRIYPLGLFLVQDTLEASLMDFGGYLTIRLSPQADLKESIKKVENLYNKYQSGAPFEYFFLDEAFNEQYKYYDRIATLSEVFTGFAIVISCLGLFGLSAFTAEHRRKEIGIRKVLGATVSNIVGLLAKDFLLLVLLSFVISVPIAAYLMHGWLEEFAYRIQIKWWIFALAGGCSLLIAIGTISYQSIKAAWHNPVDSLRQE